MSTAAGPEVHLKPVEHGLWSMRTSVTCPEGYEQAGIAITTVTTPPLAVNVEPAGSGGVVGPRVTLSFGLEEAPPVYFNVTVHPVM